MISIRQHGSSVYVGMAVAFVHLSTRIGKVILVYSCGNGSLAKSWHIAHTEMVQNHYITKGCVIVTCMYTYIIIIMCNYSTIIIDIIKYIIMYMYM